MRIIKFKVWDRHRQKFCNWREATAIFEESPIMRQGIIHLNNDGLSEYTFLQFTGLLDCNNIEIYEGDVILWCGTKSKVEFYEECARFGANAIDENYPLYRGTLEYHNWSDAEIIGNIYEGFK